MIEESKYILGLDAATVNTGVGILDSNKNLIHYELLHCDCDNVYNRFKFIYNYIRDIILKYNISIIVLEDVAIGSKNNLLRGKELSILQGVIISLSYALDVEFELYMPNKWRSVVGTYDGTREGTKREQQKQKAVDIVNNIYNLNFKYFKSNTKTKISDDDIAEAILIARAFIDESI